MIDSSIVRAHPQAATGKVGLRARLWGAPEEALSTNIHLAVDGRGRPVRIVLMGGQRNDITLPEGFKLQYVLARKGYDSRELVELIESQGSEAVISPRSCQRAREHDKARYRLRKRIERCFAHLKQWRRVAIRDDRKPANFLATVQLASIMEWLR